LRKKEKPEIVVQAINEKENEFFLNLKNSKNIEGVEAILPSADSTQGKLVTIVFSNEWKR
jgi:hypothetical protein